MTTDPGTHSSEVNRDVHEALGRFFGSHNARTVHTEELVQSFVPSDPWRALIRPRSHILIGPRGAGKTHLFKMLTPKALSSWKHPEADETRAIVDYPAAIILSDRHWHAQLEGLTDGLDPELTQHVERMALAIAVMKALIACTQQRLMNYHLPLSLDSETAKELWRSIANVWGMPPAGSLRMLKDHVDIEARSLYGAVRATRETGDRSELNDLAIAELDPHQAAAVFVGRVNDFADEPERRWALLFDEVELAGAPLRIYIEELLRGASDLLHIKISLAPYINPATAINTPMGGMAGHDFVPISLTYPEKRRAEDFTFELMERRLSKSGIKGDVRELLGPSDLDESEESEYAAVDTYKKLASRDPSFSEYLESKHVDLDNIDALTKDQRAAWLRKPRGAVSIREFYGFKTGGGERSRQRPTPFTGATGISAILEGNARWILGLAEQLADANPAPGKMIPEQVQAKTVQRAAESFHNFLSQIPNSHGDAAPTRIDPVAIADRIAEYFRYFTIKSPFRPEPPTTFRVPEEVPDELLASLQTLMHAGALIHIPDSENQVAIGTPAGLRFRLAYILAPINPFPLRISKEVSLDRVLAGLTTEQLQLGADQQLPDPADVDTEREYLDPEAEDGESA